ncbi:hypothetical protein ACFRDV_11835 [Streptomyces fagopyri]|uniref:hypothetical protein n=1 Tax=Streptomyces fagopyri TaxID=2662397 RepID=UPI003687A989
MKNQVNKISGVSVSAVPSPGSVAGLFVERVAQDDIDLPFMAEQLAAWAPVF